MRKYNKKPNDLGMQPYNKNTLIACKTEMPNVIN